MAEARAPPASQLNYALVVLHSLTAAFGPGIWRVEIFDLLPVGPPGWLPKSVQHATTNELVIAGVSARHLRSQPCTE